jgi:predicted MFS family arabinose efflux permease
VCIVRVASGLGVLPFAEGWLTLTIAAVLFGGGFSTCYPAFSAQVLRRVGADRRGAAFGAMLAAFDVGIGSGSVLLGPLAARLGFGGAFAIAAAVAASAWPFFLWSERRFSLKTDGGADARSVSRA